MSLATHLSGDLAPTTFSDFLDDCREVNGILALPRRGGGPLRVRPTQRPLVIDLNALDTAALLEGWGTYGS